MTNNKTDISKNPAYKALFESVSSHKVWEDVKSAGGDPNALFANFAPKAFDVYPNDASNVRSKFVIGRFMDAVKVLKNKDNTGLIIGTYDNVPKDGNFSSKKPETAVLLKGDGSLIKVSIFDHTLYNKPGIYNVNLNYNEERENYIANSVLEYKPITKNPIPALCAKACGVGFDWNELDPSTYPTVVLKGTAHYVQASPRFDGGAKVGDEPLYMENHRLNSVMIPVLHVILDREGTDNRVTVAFDPTNNGIPFLGDASINGMLKNMDKSGLSESQILPTITNMIRGNEYVIVGSLTKIGTYTDKKDGTLINDIRIRALCMLNVNENPFADADDNNNDAEVEALAEKVSAKKPAQRAATAAAPAEEEIVEDEEEVEEEEVIVEQPPKRVVKKPASSAPAKKPVTSDFF